MAGPQAFLTSKVGKADPDADEPSLARFLAIMRIALDCFNLATLNAFGFPVNSESNASAIQHITMAQTVIIAHHPMQGHP